MRYSEILKKAINNTDLSLTQISTRLKRLDINASKPYLSKLQNGVVPPGSDKLNEALALVLEINPLELKTAAYLEKIPKDVLNYLINQTA